MEPVITKREIDLGVVQQKSTTIRTVPVQEKPFYKISTSCGCTGAYTRGNQLIVTYHAPEFPKHLSILGKTMMESAKTITIKYKDGEKEVITLKATIVP